MPNEKISQNRIAHVPGISEQIGDRAAALERIMQILGSRELPEPPPVRVKKHRAGYQYYLKEEGGGERYVTSAEREILRLVFQAEYDRKLLAAARREKEMLGKYLSLVSGAGVDTVYEKMAEGKKSLIRPMIPTDEEYLKTWENMQYEKKPFPEDAAVHRTMKGEKVRSKSEELIANALFAADIPYHYEKPLVLGRQTIHPDFSILEMKTRKIIYWEHFGLMDEKEYVRNAVRRLSDYAAAGIFPGDKLIVTFETNITPLTTADVRKVIEKYLKPPQKR